MIKANSLPYPKMDSDFYDKALHGEWVVFEVVEVQHNNRSQQCWYRLVNNNHEDIISIGFSRLLFDCGDRLLEFFNEFWLGGFG